MTESTNIRITAIIPAYNAAATIRETLDSALVQDRDDLEIIVVDDCSTDATCQILINECPNIRIIKNEVNTGPAGARNKGIAEAKGQWIAFLDSDDTWLPHHLHVLLELAGENPDVALLCGSVVSLAGAPGHPRTRRPAARSLQKPNNQQPATNNRRIPLREFALRNPIATSTVLVKKEALQAVGGFDESFRGPEDFDLWMRIAAKYPIMKTEMPLTQYREQSGSLSMDDRTFLPEVLRVLDKGFGDGGVLQEYANLKTAALSGQYWNASWMAFSRGDRILALKHLARSCRLNREAEQKTNHPWARMAARYLVGRRAET